MMSERAPLRLATLALLAFAHAASADPSFDAIDDAIVTSEFALALQLVDAQLLESPEDASLLFRRARIQRSLGEVNAALLTLNKLRQRHPNDVDYALARAQVLASLNRDVEALTDLRDATELAPDYEDVWQLRHTLLLRQRDDATQLELELLSQRAARRFPQSSWWQITERQGAAKWSMLIGAGHDSLDNGSPSWQQQFIEISRAHDAIGNYRIGIVRDQRYDESDLTVRLGGDIAFDSEWFATIEVTTSSSPSFQPDLGFSASIGRALAKGWVANLRYRRREYEAVTVGSTSSTIEKYVGDYRIAYVLGLSHLHGASNSLNHTATASWYVNDRMSFGVSISTGEEAEVIGPGQVLQTDVRGVALNGHRQFTDRFGLRWWLGLHEQGDFYRRRFLGLAVSIQL